MDILILGGTFNPVHYGHLFVAEEVRQAYDFNKVLLIPANRPAHKTLTEQATAAQRLAMLGLAVKGNAKFVVSDVEIKRGGISYTIDTVRALKKREPSLNRIGLAIGDDLAENFTTWKEAEALAEQTEIIILHRICEKEIAFPYKHRYYKNMIYALSSSQIRERLGYGQTVRYLLPDRVRTYILKHGLYT